MEDIAAIMKSMGLRGQYRQDQFWEACSYGNISKVRKFIQDGINVDWRSQAHNSCPLHVASQGKVEIVRLLIEANCDLNPLDDWSNSPLHHAAMRGHSDCIEVLAEAGADLDSCNKKGWTALHCAAYWCRPAAVETLLREDASVTLLNSDDRSALHEAARSRSNDEVSLERLTEALIEAGTDIEALAGEEGGCSFTPLMFACFHGHLGVSRQIIEAGCDVNAVGGEGWTALHWAAQQGHAHIISLLLAAGADTEALNQKLERPVDRAQTPEIKRLLCNYNKRNQHPTTNNQIPEVTQGSPQL